MSVAAPHFSPDLFGFLRDLRENNTRAWFDANRDRYRQAMQEPAIRFVLDFGAPLAEISPAFRADPRPVGGSIFRIHRDMRFVKEGGPYKTTLGIQFRHEGAKDAHAPGFYVHIEPGNVFVGMGLWRPDGPATRAIRERMLEDPTGWRKATSRKAFESRLALEGESLVRAPRGIDPEHPLVEDLRRKDFIAVAHLSETEVLSGDFVEQVAGICQAGAPLMRWLCGALELRF